MASHARDGGCAGDARDPAPYIDRCDAAARPELTYLEEAIAFARKALRFQAETLRLLEQTRHRMLAEPSPAGASPNARYPDSEARPPADDTDYQLTAQEQRVIWSIGQGHSNRYIAKRMGISEKTVKNYVYSIFRKLGVHSRTEAALIALRRGWVPVEGAASEGAPDSNAVPGT
ncbi:helix-turn-helix transcriptional regulator [Actinomadura rubrisoli]|uniref:Response regulator transcription factor n=1 Tax=Actinomadura rubrisoli TaxID=2530368 RepID=A0A4R5CGJ5_9ACTN|nr:response regulator transcription factor [Actinomadura rubrisoli]TDD98146.1 response regulator transcription factor [Actinomadura rubrisoli]